MNNLVQLAGSLLLILATAYPLFDLIQSFGDIEHRVSILTVGLITIWLVAVLLCGILWFYNTWLDITEGDKQLHFKGSGIS